MAVPVWRAELGRVVEQPTAIALGNFDGLHRGHQQVIAPVLAWRRSPAGASTLATVVSFDPHPQVFFRGESRLALTPRVEKVQVLRQLGLEQLALVPFTTDLANLAPEAFVETVLLGQLRAQFVSVGENFRFGQQRRGTAADLRAIAARSGVTVAIVPLATCGADRISSSIIREYLAAGAIDDAQRLLGRTYTLHGPVTTGQQLGRTLGFPTANVQLPEEKFLPRLGVYAVRVAIAPGEASISCELPPFGGDRPGWPGVANLGYRPTVTGMGLVFEVHLLDWAGDLYGQSLVVELVDFLRPEQRFASLEALRQQIAQDAEAARQRLRSPVTIAPCS